MKSGDRRGLVSGRWPYMPQKTGYGKKGALAGGGTEEATLDHLKGFERSENRLQG